MAMTGLEFDLLKVSMDFNVLAAAIDASLTHDVIVDLTEGRMDADTRHHLFEAIDAVASACDTLRASLQTWQNVGNAPPMNGAFNV